MLKTLALMTQKSFDKALIPRLDLKRKGNFKVDRALRSWNDDFIYSHSIVHLIMVYN